MHHGGNPPGGKPLGGNPLGGNPLGGKPPRTASAANVAMTTSRVVSRKTTNQNPDAIWHHHSYLVPGEPERLNT